MIIIKGIKIERIYVGDKRIKRAYIGDKLIYNCYVIPKQDNMWIPVSALTADSDIHSNTEWQLT